VEDNTRPPTAGGSCISYIHIHIQHITMKSYSKARMWSLAKILGLFVTCNWKQDVYESASVSILWHKPVSNRRILQNLSFFVWLTGNTTKMNALTSGTQLVLDYSSLEVSLIRISNAMESKHLVTQHLSNTCNHIRSSAVYLYIGRSNFV